jgi:hypothetical protein
MSSFEPEPMGASRVGGHLKAALGVNQRRARELKQARAERGSVQRRDAVMIEVVSIHGV